MVNAVLVVVVVVSVVVIGVVIDVVVNIVVVLNTWGLQSQPVESTPDCVRMRCIVGEWSMSCWTLLLVVSWL